MESLMAARVVQLHRHVEQLRETVSHHHHVMADVAKLLENAKLHDCDHGRISEIQRRIHTVMERQSKLLDHRFFDKESGEWNPKDDASQRMDALRDAESRRESGDRWATNDAEPLTMSFPTPEAAQKSAEACALKLRDATTRLLSLWFHHLGSKINRELAQPEEKFEAFHADPSENTLAEFMDAFQFSRTAISEMLQPASADNAALGPRGNPFEMDDRLMKLFQLTIKDTILLASTRTEEPALVQSHVKPKDARRESSTPPVVPPTPRQPEVKGPPASEWPPRPLEPARMGLRTSRASSSQPSTPGRHSRLIHDSSQMRDMLSGASVPRCSRPSTPSEQSLDSTRGPTRLQQLQSTLHQLEMQLAGIAVSSRDTGSEAKYYALTKKLQKVRAEVLKEQRELDELRRVERDAAATRMAKEEHRRVFRR